MRAVLSSQVGAALLLAAVAAGAHATTGPPSTAVSAGSSERTSLPPTLPVRRDAVLTSDTSGLTPALAVLSIAGAAGGLWLWRRGATRPLGRRLGLRGDGAAPVRISSQALTPHASVHAVRWRGEEYLVACTTQQVTLLSRKEADEVPRVGS
jgi:hypothetical protein